MPKNQKTYGGVMLAFIICVFAVFAAVLIIPATREVFETLSADHPYIMGFIKFALLATAGELIAVKMASGKFSKPAYLTARIIIWGLIGVWITYMMKIYFLGSGAMMTAGLLPGGHLENAGFGYKLVGSSDTVTAQIPAGGAIVPNNAEIILYCGEEASTEPCTVPDVMGMSAAQANKAITNAGLIMRMAGTTASSSGNVYVISQETEAGTKLSPGEVVTVRFGDRSVLD
jgi:hypothetical protein